MIGLMSCLALDDFRALLIVVRLFRFVILECTLQSVQALEERLWSHQHPLRRFGNALSLELLSKLEDRGLGMDHLLVLLATACLWTHLQTRVHTTAAAPPHRMLPGSACNN